MITITLKALIYIVPDLINLFLSGFIYITLFNWLNSRKMEISNVTIWSLFISTIIQSICANLHCVLLTNIQFNNVAKICIYSMIGALLSIITVRIQKSRLIQRILYNTNNKSINDDIFNDIIDYEKPTMMQVYIKNSDIYYIGKFSYREEKGNESWIVLINYISVKKKNDVKKFNPQEANLCSSVAINLSNIERIEFIYEKDSVVWKHMTGNV